MSRPGSTCHRLNPLSSDGRVTGEIDDLSASWARDSLCAVEISADRDRIDRELVHRFLSEEMATPVNTRPLQPQPPEVALG